MMPVWPARVISLLVGSMGVIATLSVRGVYLGNAWGRLPDCTLVGEFGRLEG
jgi:hypothetical protein